MHEIISYSRKTIRCPGYSQGTGMRQKLNGAMEGGRYIVTWALGHLVTLDDPEGYDKKYREWKMEHLPMIPKKMELVVIKQTAKQYNAVKTQLYRNDVGEIIIATDAGREENW